MHILIIPSWYPSSVGDIGGSFFREQALALHRHGCKVGVIFPELRSLKKWKKIFSEKRGEDFTLDEGVATYRSYGVNWFPRILAPAAKLFILHGRQLYNRYVAENGVPDIVHAHSILHGGLLAFDIKNRHGVPFVISEHSSAYASGLISKKGLSLAKKAAVGASKKFAVSGEFANLLNEILDSGEIKWEEMPNIVNREFLEASLGKGDKNSEFEFINVALMNQNKRQNNIVLAFEKVYKKYKNCRLVLGGDGPEREKLERLVHELGLRERVTFTGLLSRSEVLKKISTADSFVLASSYETFGVVVIEALALGKPVIATRCGGPESILRQEDGILVPINNVDALANAMDEMIKNKNRFNSTEIRKMCFARYGEKAIATRLEVEYEKIISHGLK